MLNRPTRALGTAALAVTLSLGASTPAMAHGGHDGGYDGSYGDGHSRGYDGDHHGDGDHDGGDRWDDHDGDGWDGDRDGHDGDGWDGDRDRWDGHDGDGWDGHDGDGWDGDRWDGDRWDGKDWSHKRDSDKSDREDKASNAADKSESFADWQAMVVKRLNHADEFLVGMADRIKGSDMDPAVRDAVLGAVQAYRAKVAELTSEAKAADSRKELRAVFGEYETLYPRLFFGMGCNVKQARMTHFA